MNSRTIQRQVRIRKKMSAVSDRLRLSVHRTNMYSYAQILDKDGKVLLGVSEKVVVKDDRKNSTPIERARQVGAAIAKLALEKKIKEVAFDKGRFAYHGRVKALAEGAREGGLQF
jgi:large subunit ribosomal protein L18